MNAKRSLSRRQFLTGTGVAIALPFFPSLFPRMAWADGDGDAAAPPTRLLFMTVPFGFVPNKSLMEESTDNDNNSVKEILDHAASVGWFPEQEGAGYTMPDVHASLEPYRQHMSFIKGLENRRYRADGHNADDAFLTCADTLADPARSFSNSVSCDQLAAGQLSSQDVRCPSLVLSSTGGFYGMRAAGLSWSAQGTPIMPLRSPAQVFDRLFGKDDVPAATRLQRFKDKRSVLDQTRGQLAYLNGRLNDADQRKLDEVATAVRDVEADIQREERWLDIPKPPPPEGLTKPQWFADNTVGHNQRMFDLIHAAFLTDSTRIVTYMLPQTYQEVTRFDKHSLNHPNGDPEKAKDAFKQDRANSEQLAYLLKSLCASKDHDGQALIQHTLAVYGNGVWGPNHGLRNLPILLLGHGGGRIKQGATHKLAKHTPLANLWLTMLQTAGVGAKSFADSTGPVGELLA